ncbi:neutral zinc metallopeptidase [Falsihalocynthiibacter sp. SS001]|uniref:KPN_02809 family neutral zinc metallopeptidase n=1 Tax=Falsihalocynthiibacter sp. SS001 TaxID=3349698 RepID=UPI0036D431A8
MRWQGRRGSKNIEDRRRSSRGAVVGGGGIGVVVIALLVWALGGDPVAVLQSSEGVQPSDGQITPADEQSAEFVSVVLADTEEIWADIFREQLGQEYIPATLVLFKVATMSGCGGANAATGPFYCPTDKKIYLDTDFFVTLSRQLGANGDFAAAYVVAHEVGHHVQDLIGILGTTTNIRQQVGEAEANAISVLVELQADCFAGLWANKAEEKFGSLERGDIAEAINAAEKIGDDTLQRNAGRRPMPDSFTHGTSEQRQHWFAQGYLNARIDSCDTFQSAFSE